MKPTILVPLVLAVLLALELGSCGPSGTNVTAAPATPVSETDAMINDYEKAANEYRRLAKKHTAGDVSITVLLIQARENLQDQSAKVQQAARKLTPQQAQRVVTISAATAPYLQQYPVR